MRLWFRKKGGLDPFVEVQSGSGYRREKAVRDLGSSGSPEAIPLLLERLNDWVPQVRMAAREAILAYIGDYRERWLDLAPELLAMPNKTRADHSDIRAMIDALFMDAGAVSILHRAMNERAGPKSRYAYALAFRTSQWRFVDIAKRVLEGDDISLRREVTGRLRSLDDSEFRAIEIEGSFDRFTRTRIAFLSEAFRRKLPNLEEHLACALMDKSVAVRNVALHFSEAIGLDAQRIYKRAFTEPPSPKALCIGIWGVSKFGDKSAIPRLRELLDERSNAVVRCALAALADLNDPDSAMLLKSKLQGEDLGMSRFAAQMLVRNRWRLELEKLKELADTRPHTQYLRLVVLPLNELSSKWDRLEFLLWLARQHTLSDACGAIEERLRRWNYRFNASQQPLSSQQRGRLLDLLSKIEAAPWCAKQLELLQFTLRSAR